MSQIYGDGLLQLASKRYEAIETAVDYFNNQHPESLAIAEISGYVCFKTVNTMAVLHEHVYASLIENVLQQLLTIERSGDFDFWIDAYGRFYNPEKYFIFCKSGVHDVSTPEWEQVPEAVKAEIRDWFEFGI